MVVPFTDCRSPYRGGLTTLPFSGVVPSVSEDHVRLQRRVRQLAGSPNWLHQLDAIAKGIGDVNARITFERVLEDLNTSLTKTFHQRLKFAHKQRRMSLSSRTKVHINSEVNLDRAAFDPNTAPLGKVRRLWNLGDAKQPRIEPSRLCLSPRGHRQLHVFDSDDWH